MGYWLATLLFVLLLAAGPWWPYSRGWGYAPVGIVLAALLLWLFIIWSGVVVPGWPLDAGVPDARGGLSDAAGGHSEAPGPRGAATGIA